jgi:hypothetical protein
MQRHSLPLHVGSHEGPIGVVVLEKRNQPGRHAHHLARRDVDVFDLVGRHEHEVATLAGHDRVSLEFAIDYQSIGRGEAGFVFLVGPQPNDIVGEFGLGDLAIWRDEEPVGIDAGVDREAGDQPDVRAFRCFNRADPAVVRDMNVAHLEAGPLAVEPARAERREPPLMREHRERVGLVDHLRKLTTAEEILDRRRDALGVDERSRRHFRDVLEAHPLLHGATQFEEALPQFVAGKFV